MPQTHAHGVGALRRRMRTGKQRAEEMLPAQRPRRHGSAFGMPSGIAGPDCAR